MEGADDAAHEVGREPPLVSVERSRFDRRHLPRGDVRWGPTPHESSPAYRPWLVVSDDAHPFADEECIVVALTTTAHEDGIAMPDDAWTAGGSETDSYVSP